MQTGTDNVKLQQFAESMQRTCLAGAFRFEMRDPTTAVVANVCMKPLEPDGAAQISPLVRELCAFLVRASGLQSSLEAFMMEQCVEFRDGSLSGEQKLHWTDLHKRYVELAEEQLDDFLRERGATADELAQTLQSSLGKSMWSLPLLQSLDYKAFAAQMIALASGPQLRAEAAASSGQLGGVWKPQKSDPRSLERFLKAQGVPWILRRLHVFATIREICVVEMPGTVPMFTIWESRNHGFGVCMSQVVADGIERHDGVLGTKAWLQDSDLHVVQSPDGLSGVETVYTVLNDGSSLLIRREVSGSGGDNESLSFSQEFVQCEPLNLLNATTPSTGVPHESRENVHALRDARPAQLNCLPQPVSPLETRSPYPKVPTPPLMPSAPAGTPSRQPIARRRFHRPAAPVTSSS